MGLTEVSAYPESPKGGARDGQMVSGAYRVSESPSPTHAHPPAASLLPGRASKEEFSAPGQWEEIKIQAPALPPSRPPITE